jgi:predicted phosphodiesterase
MRLAIISDIHGNLVALEQVLRDIALRAPDLIVNLGDCATSPLWPRETLELLATQRMLTVRGNHDRLIAEPPARMPPSMRFTYDALTAGQRAVLGALPPSLSIEPDVLAVHGTPSSDSQYLLERLVDDRLSLNGRGELDRRLGDTTARLVFCGHSHHQHSAFASSGRLIVNPGAVGCPRYADNDDRELAESGSPHARFAVATRRGSRRSIELVVLEYNWRPVVIRATENGRGDWARGFAGA